MKRFLAAGLLAGLVHTAAFAQQDVTGLAVLESSHDVATTADRLVAALEDKGLTLFTRIDHAAAAKTADMSLPPTELVIFGNPKAGTALMHCAHTVAIDLPLKALIWEDGEGQVWLGYNTPAYLAERHQISGCQKVLEKVRTTLDELARTAVE